MTCELDVAVYQKTSELKEKLIGMLSLCSHLLHWSHCTHSAIILSLSFSSNDLRQPGQMFSSLESRFFFPFSFSCHLLPLVGFLCHSHNIFCLGNPFFFRLFLCCLQFRNCQCTDGFFGCQTIWQDVLNSVWSVFSWLGLRHGCQFF